ncbi:MAG: hypothetical protein IJJ14_08440, partial [Coriobacteriales bacterium]|nr:hypothetical protein [Coriobacteriales bacterium]
MDAGVQESASQVIRRALFGAERGTGSSLTSCYLMAIAGVGFAIVADEFRRFPNTIGINPYMGTTVPSLICTVLILILVLLAYRMKPGFRFTQHPILVFGLTLALTLGTFAFFYMPSSLSEAEAERYFVTILCITKSLSAVLLVFWMEAVSRAGMRKTLLIFGLSLFVVAIFKTLLALLVGGAVTILMSVSSLISGVFLVVFAKRSESNGFLGDEMVDQEVLASENEHNMLAWFYPIAAFGYAAISALCRNSWRALNTAGDSQFVSSFGDIVGAVLAAFLLLYFISKLWSKQWVDFVKAALLPLSIFLLYCTTFIDSSLVFVYATACGTYKRLLIFFVCGFFFYRHRHNQMIPFVVALIATRLGILFMYLNRLLIGRGDEMASHLLVCITLLGLILITLYVIFHEYRNKMLLIEEANEGQEDTGSVSTSEENSGIRQRALKEISESLQLSGRESDILPYIADEMML